MPDLQTIGQVELISLPEQGVVDVPARIDTGARTTAIWASGIIEKDNVLEFVFFGPDSKYYTGNKQQITSYSKRVVSSSIGGSEVRYVIKLVLVIKGRKIRANFTLANRAEQTYPILVGRNVLRGKFIVDVSQGQPLKLEEKARSAHLQHQLAKDES